MTGNEPVGYHVGKNIGKLARELEEGEGGRQGREIEMEGDCAEGKRCGRKRELGEVQERAFEGEDSLVKRTRHAK